MYIVVHTCVTSRDLLSESTPSKVKKRYNSNNSSLFVYYSSDDIKWEDICPYIKPNAQLLQGATTEGRDEVVKISKIEIHTLILQTQTGLESKLDNAIDKGRYDAAALLSDKISERKVCNGLSVK